MFTIDLGAPSIEKGVLGADREWVLDSHQWGKPDDDSEARTDAEPIQVQKAPELVAVGCGELAAQHLLAS